MRKYQSSTKVHPRKMVSSCQRSRSETGVQRIAAQSCLQIKPCKRPMLSITASIGLSCQLWYVAEASSSPSIAHRRTPVAASRGMRGLPGRLLTSCRWCTRRRRGLHVTASTCMTSCSNTSIIRGRKKTSKWSSKNLTTQTSPCSSWNRSTSSSNKTTPWSKPG